MLLTEDAAQIWVVKTVCTSLLRMNMCTERGVLFRSGAAVVAAAVMPRSRAMPGTATV